MAKRGLQEGSYFKRSNGTWGAAIQIDGKRRYVYAKTRKEVQEKLLALQKDAKAGVFAPAYTASIPRLGTVRDFLEYWVTTIAKRNVRPKTWDHYELCVRRMLPHIGRIK